MSDAEIVKRRRGVDVLEWCVKIATILILVGVTVIGLRAESRANGNERELNRLKASTKSTLHQLDFTLDFIKHAGTCNSLYLVYRANRGEVARPAEVAPPTSANGGLVVPSLQVLSKRLSGCQDLLDPANLSPPKK